MGGNIDESLAAAICSFVDRAAALRVLPDEQATLFLGAAASRHVLDPHVRWWWTALRDPSTSLNYGKGDGPALLARIIPDARNPVLAVTDDDDLPWMLIEGPLSDLVDLLGALRVCEYFLCPIDNSWMLFDTHHNDFVGVGEAAQWLRGSASSTC